MIAHNNSDDEPLGAEGHSAPRRDDNGLTPLHNARLESMAARRGWIKARWPIAATLPELLNAVQERGSAEPTLAERTVVAAHALLASDSPRAVGIGARLVVAMAAQNQRDDLAGDGVDLTKNMVTIDQQSLDEVRSRSVEELQAELAAVETQLRDGRADNVAGNESASGTH